MDGYTLANFWNYQIENDQKAQEMIKVQHQSLFFLADFTSKQIRLEYPVI